MKINMMKKKTHMMILKMLIILIILMWNGPTGPYAARSDVEHQVNHGAKISQV